MKSVYIASTHGSGGKTTLSVGLRPVVLDECVDVDRLTAHLQHG
jgi:hypothetical protein